MKTAPPTILSSGAKSPLTKAFVLIAPFLDQINTICAPIKFNNFNFQIPGFRSLNLLQNVTSTVNEVCRRLKSEEKSSTIKNSRLVPNSVCAVKNGRRKMEDRHVVLHDINMIFSGHANQVEHLGIIH